MKPQIITYGCTANQADSELMHTFLEKSGIDSSEYIIVNTCGVKQATEEKIINKLKKLAKTDKKIIIGGCLPRVNLNRIKKEVPGYSAILDTRSIDRLPYIIKSIERGKRPVVFSKEIFSKPSFAKSFGLTSTIQVSEGCDLSCAYCSTTISRGDLSCFSIPDIVRAASNLLKDGSKEILLTSQDNGAYSDGKKKLPELLNSICKIDSNFYIRNGMSNPLYLPKFLDKLINSYKNQKMYKFLHIPVQSGSNLILKEMKRGYTKEMFLQIVKKFKQELLAISIATDVIVGFPGETKKDFKQTLDVLRQVKPDMTNVSRFSKRTGTKAVEMDQVPDKIIKKRSKECSLLGEKLALENNKKWIGWSGRIFVGEPGKLMQIGEKSFIGRNFAYKAVLIKSEKSILGMNVDAQITGARQGCLIGEII